MGPPVLNLSVPRVLADFTHLASKCVLLWTIHSNRSAEGVSLLTQALYTLVFLTRYSDLLEEQGWRYGYNVAFKLFYIISSFYTLFLMMKVFPRTREKERAWKMALGSIAVSLILSPIVIPIFDKFTKLWFLDLLWAFSIILESVCVLPQLLLLRQTTVPTVINSYYLLMLGSYRAFYIINWFVKAVNPDKRVDWISIIFGVIQTAFYVDFAWVYYSRQRVKLRNGGVVDSEDYRSSYLVNKVFNIRRRRSEDEEEQRLHGENDGEEHQPRNNRWGARGISVSADDTLESQRHGQPFAADRDAEGFSDDESN
ncbi:ER lumen protein retaining receptor-domain-containing protein [Aspergillus pseudoustus]|uniref:ER lumen protein retaining receptor-domain-containing protein n=1 Tax=Aspergillus pseudoustus TaxID=1810923 RepID=A0ABR4JWU2_9EURO